MVLSADGTSLGEAFVHLRGGRAKLRLALAKDRSVMPVSRGACDAAGCCACPARQCARAASRQNGRLAHFRCPAPSPQTTHTPVEVLTAVEDDMQRRMFSGCMLV